MCRKHCNTTDQIADENVFEAHASPSKGVLKITFPFYGAVDKLPLFQCPGEYL